MIDLPQYHNMSAPLYPTSKKNACISLFSGWLQLCPSSCSYLLFVKRECFCSCHPWNKPGRWSSIVSTLPKKSYLWALIRRAEKMLNAKICSHLEPAVVPYDTLHWKDGLELSEHVLRGDGQDLASSCSYRSLLALLLLPCFLLIKTDRGYTGLCLHQWIERVVLTCLSLWGMNTGRERMGEVLERAQDFKNISTDMSPAKYAAFSKAFHKLIKDAGLQKQEHGMTEHCLLERSVFF